VKSTAEHREILTHLRNGDGAGARRLFRAHRKRATRELLTILETYRLPQL
jgi:DNA-binding GntR family transcriptional regulator